jgi:hypothetical protein
VAFLCEQTVPTERPPLVGEVSAKNTNFSVAMLIANHGFIHYFFCILLHILNTEKCKIIYCITICAIIK